MTVQHTKINLQHGMRFCRLYTCIGKAQLQLHVMLLVCAAQSFLWCSTDLQQHLHSV